MKSIILKKRINSPPKCLLIVEDEMITAMANAKMLEARGYHIIIVSSGIEAIEKVDSAPDKIDLILMDIDLGTGMDGTEAAQDILRDHDIPIIFLLSHTEEEIIKKIERITSYGYVAKNSGVTVLIASIKMAFKLHEVHRILKLKEGHINKSENNLWTIFETTGTAIVVFNEDSVIIHANTKFAQLAGYTVREIVRKKKWVDFVVRNDMERMLSLHRLRMENTETSPKEYEFKFINKSGDIRDIFLTIDVIPETTNRVASLMDITENQRSKKLLCESENKFRTIFNLSPIPVIITDLELHILDINDKICERCKFNRDEIIGKRPTDDPRLFRLESPEEEAGLIQKFQQQGGMLDEEIQLIRPIDNEKGTAILFSRLVEIGGKKSIISIVFDITKRKAAEEMVRSSLKEIQILLQELHHRTKNNMQVICSMLSLKSASFNNQEVIVAFKEIENQIHSMALVHEELYKSENLSSIDMREYVQSLVENLNESYCIPPDKISMIVDVADVTLTINNAIPCGLVLNELITNAIKHAFPGDRKGEIMISISKDNENDITMSITDNGIGINRENNINGGSFSGLKLIYLIVEHQLKGHILVESDKGTKFIIKFKTDTAMVNNLKGRVENNDERNITKSAQMTR